MTAIHELEKSIEIPKNVTLQSIRFKESVVEISEKNQHRFKLLGMNSDNVEREINDLAGVTYTIENSLVIERPDFEIIKTNLPGQSKLTATIGLLTATTNYDVVEDVALKQTIIADYYADYQQTGPINLKWKSLIEYNANKFILERSLDNINFTEINQQNAQGTSNIELNHNFEDNTTVNIIYYKLKALDIFNNVVFEEVVAVNRSPLTNNNFNNPSKIILYPNPTKNQFSIDLGDHINDSEILKVKLYSLQGKLIYENDKLIKVGNSVSITLPTGITPDVYIVQIQTSEFVKSEKLTIQN